jgi:hypothetical protein
LQCALPRHKWHPQARKGAIRSVGTSPGGGGAYKGSVSVTAKGDVYDVQWKIGASTYIGVGILTDSDFSIAYYGGTITGVAVYREQADGTWKGAWALVGSSRLGTENWTPR